MCLFEQDKDNSSDVTSLVTQRRKRRKREEKEYFMGHTFTIQIHGFLV